MLRGCCDRALRFAYPVSQGWAVVFIALWFVAPGTYSLWPFGYSEFCATATILLLGSPIALCVLLVNFFTPNARNWTFERWTIQIFLASLLFVSSDLLLHDIRALFDVGQGLTAETLRTIGFDCPPHAGTLSNGQSWF